MLDMLVVAALDNNQFNQNIDNYQNNKVHIVESKVNVNKNINQIENGNHPLIKKIDSERSGLSLSELIKLAETTNDKNLLVELSKKEDSMIRVGVASNPNTPQDVLKSLSQDEDKYVKYGVAGNSNTSEDVLETLSKIDNKDIKGYLIENQNTSLKTLEKLAIDDDMDISTLAMEKIESKNIKIDSNEVHNSIVSMDYKDNQQSNSNSNSNSHKHR